MAVYTSYEKIVRRRESRTCNRKTTGGAVVQKRSWRRSIAISSKPTSGPESLWFAHHSRRNNRHRPFVNATCSQQGSGTSERAVQGLRFRIEALVNNRLWGWGATICLRPLDISRNFLKSVEWGAAHPSYIQESTGAPNCSQGGKGDAIRLADL